MEMAVESVVRSLNTPNADLWREMRIDFFQNFFLVFVV